MEDPPERMKIALLAHNLKVCGGYTVGRMITGHLPALLPDCRFMISVPARADYSVVAKQPNVELVPFEGRGLMARWFWERFVLVPKLRSFGPDWIWALGNLGIAGPQCPQSLLLHDPHLLYPSAQFGHVSLGYRLRKWSLGRLLRKQLSDTRRVYTQTDTVRRLFHQQYGYPLEKIELLPPGHSRCAANREKSPQPEAMSEVSARLKLLYVSAPWGHKNHRMLIETFKQYREQLQGVRCFITLDPAMNRLGRETLARIEAEGLGGQIVSLGHLDPAGVQAAYRCADALIFPSILETAGLPLIEAMEHGLPILASDFDYARELCGEAAGFFNPHSTESVANAIVRLCQDAAYRAELSRRSAERFQSHVNTWGEVLEEVIRIEGLRESG